jgi:hypothetical protein
MSIFNRIENFPMTHENEQGVIVETTRRDTMAIAYATLQLEHIFNDNAGIRL